MWGICGVKKNEHIIKEVRKQKILFVFYNLLAYIAIFTIVGVVTMFAVNTYFYKGAKQEVYEEAKKMEMASYFYSPSPNSYRKVIVFFDSEGKLIKKPYQVDVPERIITRMTDVIRKETLHDNIDGETHYYLTLLKKVDNQEYAYAKIYLNIDGEVSASSTVLRVYAICVMSLFILAVGASYLLSSKTIKPIMSSLEKQFNFVSDASHELRTPLAIVQSKIENILTDSNKTVYEVSEDLAISLKELNRLTKLTSDLLLLARGDNDSMQLDLEYTNLDQLIKNAIEPFKELAELENKIFKYEGMNVVAKVDKNKIYQVIIILLDNALSYTNDGDEVKVSLGMYKDEIIISVNDTGIGTSASTKEHMFERFYRADKARSRSRGGNGLGLSIAKTIINYHHGKIYVEDNKPKGTKIVIMLPKGKAL